MPSWIFNNNNKESLVFLKEERKKSGMTNVQSITGDALGGEDKGGGLVLVI